MQMVLPIRVTQTFELFMQLPLELHYYFLQRLPATIQVFAACACKAWYEMTPKKLHIDICGIAQFARLPLLIWLSPLLNNSTVLEVIRAACLTGQHWLVQWVRYKFPAVFIDRRGDCSSELHEYVDIAMKLNQYCMDVCKLHEYTLIAMQRGHIMVVRELLSSSSHILGMCRTCYVDSTACHQKSIEIMKLADKTGDEKIFQIIAKSISKINQTRFIEYAIMADLPMLYKALTTKYNCYPLETAIQHRKTDYIKHVVNVIPLIKYHIGRIVVDNPGDAAYIQSVIG